jgi:hypothetical protein
MVDLQQEQQLREEEEEDEEFIRELGELPSLGNYIVAGQNPADASAPAAERHNTPDVPAPELGEHTVNDETSQKQGRKRMKLEEYTGPLGSVDDMVDLITRFMVIVAKRFHVMHIAAEAEFCVYLRRPDGKIICLRSPGGSLFDDWTGSVLFDCSVNKAFFDTEMTKKLGIPPAGFLYFPTEVQQQVVTALVNAFIPKRKTDFPFTTSNRDMVKASHSWWPAGVDYKPAQKMSSLELQAVFDSLVSNNAKKQDNIAAAIKSLSLPPTLQQQLLNLVWHGEQLLIWLCLNCTHLEHDRCVTPCECWQCAAN